jgi:hypothetical protein
MSTFGKKSLIWWDYDDHSKGNAIRYLHTPLDLQLKILEKWYPIGLRFTKDKGWGSLYQDSTIYKIIGYQQFQTFWGINAQIIEGRDYRPLNQQSGDFINPVTILVEEDSVKIIKREYKLERILRKWENR